MKDRLLIFVGDIHGKLRELIWKVVEQYKLKNVDLVVLGDFGVGFGKSNSMYHLYKRVENKLIKNDIMIYTIRGNHDNPDYFDGNHNFERLIFLEDYKLINISGITIYPIGGATSIDRTFRKKYNEKMEKYGSSKRCWWENESVKKIDFKDLSYKTDIVISHSSPISFTPLSIRTDDIEIDVWKDILNERNYLEEIKNEINYKYWFFGHYHESTSGNFGNSMYRCLDIMEFLNFNK